VPFSLSSRRIYTVSHVNPFASSTTRHVILPKELAKTLPKSRLLTETEWRQIGVQQSRGWTHYAIHRPEPHILLFRRPLGTDPQSGRVDPELERMAREEYKNQFGILRK
jgi:cyclin-dependent kinase regulatory subunit CKS1